MSWPVQTGGTPDVRGAFVSANNTSGTRGLFEQALAGSRGTSVADVNPDAGRGGNRLVGIFQQAQATDAARVNFRDAYQQNLRSGDTRAAFEEAQAETLGRVDFREMYRQQNSMTPDFMPSFWRDLTASRERLANLRS